MSDAQPIPFLTDPEIARRIRRTADDLAVERRRASTASEGLEADLRELADELQPDGTMEDGRSAPDHGTLPLV